VCVIAGGDCSDGSVEVLDNGALQVLRLKILTAPASGRSAVKTEGAAHPIIMTSTRQQSVNLSHCRLGAAEPELEHAPHLRQQIFLVELPLNRLSI
jgi:hypothetical protein